MFANDWHMSQLFTSAEADLLTFAVTPIEMCFQGKELAHGTAFFWRHNKNLKLVTNWHNFTGKNPLTGEYLNDRAAVPDQVRFYPAHREGAATFRRFPRTVRLYENFHEPFWHQHENFAENRADIAVLDVLLDDEAVVSVPGQDDPPLYTRAGSSLVVIGYPFRNYSPQFLPIWKSGTLASDPGFNWQGRPAFLIDAATRPGMSGSPVFRRVFGPVAYPNEGELTVAVDRIISTQFAGIYSGHLNAQEASITIGIGWPAYLVEEIIRSPRTGTRE